MSDANAMDAEKGNLPTYSFIEPNLWHNHNDMHPPISMLVPGLAFDAPSALLGGEAFLARIYDAIRSSSSSGGSNWFNTLLMVVFDEHGGTYDHVPPPTANPPDPAGPAGQMGFTFNRLGVRLPAIAISPWISERSVVNDVHHHTSVIRTMRERWNLGKPLTGRDATAPDLAPLLTRDKPRAPEDWPDVSSLPNRSPTSTGHSSRSMHRCRRWRRCGHRFTRRPRLGHLRRRRSERLDQHGRGVPGRLHRARAGDVPGLGRAHPEGARVCTRTNTSDPRSGPS